MEGFFSLAEMSSTRRPLSVLPKCGACGLYKTCKSPKMKVSGDGRLGVLVVGEAPGAEEDDKGLQFVGKTGKMLQDVLWSFDVKLRRDCSVTNALICRPPGNVVKDEMAVDYCRPNLMNTIKERDPRIIVLLGGRAVRSLIGQLWREDVGAMRRWVGWQIPCQKPNAWVCPTWHPSYIVREVEANPNTGRLLERQFRQHLEAAFSVKGRPPVRESFEDKIEVILDPDEAARRIRNLVASRKTLSFDFETNMLKPDDWNAQIVCCAISDGVTAIAYPWHGAAITATKEFLRSDVRKVGFNIKFEDRWARRFICPIKNWVWDGMLAAHTLDHRKGITSLKFQAFVRFGQEGYDDHIKPYLQSKEQGGYAENTIRKLDLNNLLKYCGMDAMLEFLVYKDQLKEFDRDAKNF